MDVFGVGMIFSVILRRLHPITDVNKSKEEVTSYCRMQPNNENLKQLILKCTDHDPDKRPSMLEVRDELQSLLCKQDPAIITQKAAEVLKTYKLKSFIDGNSESVTPLSDMDKFE